MHALETTLQAIENKTPALSAGRIPVTPGNITNKFREAFESYDPIAGGRRTHHGDDYRT